MNTIEQFTSIMIRNVPMEARKNFELLCTAQGITVQESLRRFIISAGRLNEIQVVTNTAYALCYNLPQMVDEFIRSREPFYATLPDGPQKDMIRRNFVSSNPSYIFQRYAEELQKREERSMIQEDIDQ
jgi:hypothetical protein